ncbi:plasmid pRiA4b ORF-3 family protein [Arthrobacter sp. JSM 101049]|uniref:plasmid pRiA4b ORF-3 family protein n=1 Tax=Arthrobacter sp. JSM 101049 TaxID=929097 RepID=UPI003561B9B9
MTSDAPLLTLSVSLIGTEPEIWRRLEVDGSMPLPRFHEVLQSAMGWTNSHLHSFADRNPFEARRGTLAIVARNWFDADSLDEGLEGFDEAEETVAGALGYGDGKLWYEYDFGDRWMHVITELSRRPRSAGDPEARVLGGLRRAPLEDCGGIGGWAEVLRVWADRHDIRTRAALDGKDEDVDGPAFRLAWIEGMTAFGEDFDPEDFDVDTANVDLRLWHPGTPGAVVATHRAGRWIADLDDWGRHDFGRALHRAGIDPFGQRLPAGLPTAGAGVVAPYQWLIRTCQEQEGLSLTPNGNLTEAGVARVLDELGWRDHDTVWRGGKRENTARIVAMLRESALGAGLVRKAGRILVATAAGRKEADRPGALWQRLADRVLPGRLAQDRVDVGMLDLLVTVVDPEAPQDDLLKAIARGMDMLGYAGPGGGPLEHFRFIRYVEQLYATRTVLETTVTEGGAGHALHRGWGSPERRALRLDFARAALQA